MRLAVPGAGIVGAAAATIADVRATSITGRRIRTTAPSAQCRPLGAATIRQIHFIISGALKRAVRWGWISSNPIVFAETPPAPKAKPRPPSP